jgi:hypothetical protein
MHYRIVSISLALVSCLSNRYIQPQVDPFEVQIDITVPSVLGQVQIPDTSYKKYTYEQKYYNIASVNQQPVGVVIIAYNRPYYLSQLIASIEKNEESQSLPFFFILDGGTQATQKENCEIINRSTISNKHIILRERNFGCAKTLIDAKRFMFDWCKFEKVILMEEDLIVSPFYFKLLLNLHKWAQHKYSNVGVVQCYSYCLLNEAQKKQNLDIVQDSGKEWWSFVTYCINKEVWKNVKPILYEYESRFVDAIPCTDDFFQARSRPALWNRAEEIRAWVRGLIEQKLPIKRDERELFVDTKVDFKNYFCSIAFEPNEDIIMAFALWLFNYVKIKTVVNRVKHIGEIGITYDPKLYAKMKHNQIQLDNFQEDAFLDSFQVLP